MGRQITLAQKRVLRYDAGVNQNHHKEEPYVNHMRNQKINQITDLTLIIGVDIAKETHYACAVDNRGRELSKSWKVKQSRHGFEGFEATLQVLLHQHHKSECVVAFEPTGHYWMNLAKFLEQRGIPYVYVNPFHVKRTKELQDNLQSKNDQKDARLIGKMIPQGHYQLPRETDETEQALRTGQALRERLMKDRISIINRIRRWLDLYFPEFSSIYKELRMRAKGVLEIAPLPIDVALLGAEGLREKLTERGIKGVSRKQMKTLYESAIQSIGVPDSLGAARMEIACLLAQLQLYEAQLDELDEKCVELAKQLPDFEYLTSVPGISETMVAELLAETGSLKRYADPRQLIKLAGLTLTAQESGKSKGHKKISKRGRKRLRSLLFRSVLPLIHHNPVFHALFMHYKNRTANPLTGKEALVVLGSKLLKIFHGLCHRETHFQAERMQSDIPFLAAKPAA